MTRAPGPKPPTNLPVPVADDDAAKRRELIGLLRDDRQDLVRVARIVHELAQTLEVAQGSLAILRRALRWAALVGGVAALTVSVRTRRPMPALVVSGLSLFMVHRWLSHPVRHELATPASIEAARTRPS